MLTLCADDVRCGKTTIAGVTLAITVVALSLYVPQYLDTREKVCVSDLIGHPMPECVSKFRYRTTGVYAPKNPSVFAEPIGQIPGIKAVLSKMIDEPELMAELLKSPQDTLISLYLTGDLRRFTNKKQYKKIEGWVKKVCFLFETPPQNLERKLIEIEGRNLPEAEDCVSAAADKHLDIVSLHPFENGNGKYARKKMREVIEAQCNQSVERLHYEAYRRSVKKFLEKGDRRHFQDYIKRHTRKSN
ncbi:MAG: Fic family protein [Alphaproteobacteria bacterium]|nr:MAG: Fic family protein [Alphaproteobacteria bacterium]